MCPDLGVSENLIGSDGMFSECLNPKPCQRRNSIPSTRSLGAGTWMSHRELDESPVVAGAVHFCMEGPRLRK